MPTLILRDKAAPAAQMELDAAQVGCDILGITIALSLDV
jgi:hypothetical protein